MVHLHVHSVFAVPLETRAFHPREQRFRGVLRSLHVSDRTRIVLYTHVPFRTVYSNRFYHLPLLAPLLLDSLLWRRRSLALSGVPPLASAESDDDTRALTLGGSALRRHWIIVRS